MVAALRRERIRRRALSFAAGLPIFRCRAPQGSFPGGARRRNTGFVDVRTRGVFVGRASELAELERALEAARAGSGANVLLAGEAGIGKTRLATELASRARDAGFEVLLGRSIDLVGTELPFQPFVEALRPLGDPRRPGKQPARSCGCSRRRWQLLTERAAAVPVLLVLEDLHWADTSTLDLVVFLAHNLDDQPVLLLATYRADELASTERMRAACRRRAALGIGGRARARPARGRGAGSACSPPTPTSPLPAGLTAAIVTRSEGNPFFAEELLAAAGDERRAPARPARPAAAARRRLDHPTQSLLRVAAAAGRDVGLPAALRRRGAARERDVRESLRQAVEHGVLVADPGDRQLPLPPRAPGGGDLRDDPPRRARGAARAARRRARTRRKPPHPRSSRPTGRRRVARGSARRLGRGGPPGGGSVRPGGGARAPRAGARARGTPCPTRPSSSARPRRAVLLGGRARQPDGSGAAGGRAGAASDRARRGGRPAPRRRLYERLGHYLHESGRTTPPSPRRARGRARAGRATLGGARAGALAALAQRVDAAPGASTSRSRSASRRSRSPAPSARARGVPGARGPRPRPCLPRPRRRGRRAPLAGARARRGDAAIPAPSCACTSPSPTC